MSLTPRQLHSLRRQRRRAKRPDSLLLQQLGPADSLRTTMAEFLEHCAVLQFTASTIANRSDSLRLFALWCEARALTKPSEITRPILERYQRHLFLQRKANGRPLGASTQHHRLMAVRGYFRWLTKRGRLLANPASELELPRRPKHLPLHVLTPAETEGILALPDIATPEGLRDRAILEVLYSTGIRRTELCNLTVFSVKDDIGTVSIFEGKGRKDRVVPIGERALAWVQKYLDEARPKLVLEPDCGALFLSEIGLSMHPTRLTKMVGDYVRAGGQPRGACHLFRHVMATQMLENGADVRFLQEILGHASLESTQIYTHVSIRQLKAVHAATHPAAKLLKQKENSNEGAELLAALEAESEESQ